jgi:two-component system OmpR family response regulator
LIAEDDSEVRRLMCVFLRDAGFEVDSVSNCREVEACFDDRKYDGLVVDALLPDGSGVRLAEVRWAAGLTALIVTGSPDAMKMLEAKGMPYLPKPFRSAELLAAIKSLLVDQAPP